MGTSPCIDTAKERFKRRRRKWLLLQQDTRRHCTENTVKAKETLLRCAAERTLRSVRLTNEPAYRTTFASKSESPLSTTVLPFVRLDFLYATISIVSKPRTRSTQISSSLSSSSSSTVTRFAAKRLVRRGGGKSTPTEELDALLKEGYGPILYIFQLESANVCFSFRLSCTKRGSMRRPTTQGAGRPGAENRARPFGRRRPDPLPHPWPSPVSASPPGWFSSRRCWSATTAAAAATSAIRMAGRLWNQRVHIDS